MYLDTIAFLDTHTCINNPYWQSSGITINLCKYYIVISDTLIISWICFSYCLRYRKKCIGKFVWLRALLLMPFFVAFSVYSLPFVYSDFTYKEKGFTLEIGEGGYGYEDLRVLLRTFIIVVIKILSNANFWNENVLYDKLVMRAYFNSRDIEEMIWFA